MMTPAPRPSPVETPDLVTSVLDYVDRGMYVFPLWPLERTGPVRCACRPDPALAQTLVPACPSAGKHPMPRWTTNVIGHGLSYGDPAPWIRLIWGLHRQLASPPGVGVNLGASELLLLLDLDSERATDAWLAGPFGGLRTWAVQTGRTTQGLHLYFRQDPGEVLVRSVSQGSLSRAVPPDLAHSRRVVDLIGL